MDIRRKGEITLEILNEDLPLQTAFMAALATKLSLVVGQTAEPWSSGTPAGEYSPATTQELTELLREQSDNTNVLTHKQDLAVKVVDYELKTGRSVFQALHNPNEAAQVSSQIGVPVPVLKRFEHEIQTGTSVTNTALAIARYEARTGHTVFNQIDNPRQLQQIAQEIGINKVALQKFFQEVRSGNFQLSSGTSYAGVGSSPQPRTPQQV